MINFWPPSTNCRFACCEQRGIECSKCTLPTKSRALESSSHAYLRAYTCIECSSASVVVCRHPCFDTPINDYLFIHLYASSADLWLQSHSTAHRLRSNKYNAVSSNVSASSVGRYSRYTCAPQRRFSIVHFSDGEPLLLGHYEKRFFSLLFMHWTYVLIFRFSSRASFRNYTIVCAVTKSVSVRRWTSFNTSIHQMDCNRKSDRRERVSTCWHACTTHTHIDILQWSNNRLKCNWEKIHRHDLVISCGTK